VTRRGPLFARALILAAAAVALTTSPAQAQPAEPVRAGTLAVNLAPLACATGELRWESPIFQKLAWSAFVGFGRGRSGANVSGYVGELGGQLRWYPVGGFRRGLLLALEGAGLAAGGQGSRGETALALGPRLGYKVVGLGGLTLEANAGVAYVRKSADGVVPGTTAVLTEMQAVSSLLLGWTW
jgi:hypothetical protein